MTHIPNPHAIESAYTQDQPASLPALPFAKPTSPLGKQAASLHRAAQSATGRLSSVREAHAEAVARFKAAQAALQAEIVRGGKEGPDLDRERELSVELSAAERLADAGSFQLRYRSAVQEQRARVRDYRVFLWENVIQLLELEIRPEAETASAELVRALASIESQKQRYQAVRQRAYELLRITAAGEFADYFGRSLQLAQEPLPPLPSDEALAEFERARTPEELRDEPVAVESELVAVD
jgi:hypothetical protein